MPAVRPVRWFMIAAFALFAGLLLWIVVGALRSGVALWQEWNGLGSIARGVIAILVLASLAAIAWSGWWLFRPRERKAAAVAVPQRAQVDLQLQMLQQRRADTTELQSELVELDRRARASEMYIAVFGEISAGKSSLIRALAPTAAVQTDVVGGTTRSVGHYHTELDGRELVLADVPGTHEVSGSLREQLARDEALRAHVVMYVCSGDLTRDQDTELRWLRGFGKPIVLVLNKIDRYRDDERAALQRTLRARYSAVTDAQVLLSGGGSETFERQLPDGRSESMQRERATDVSALIGVLQKIARGGVRALESLREAAVLTAVVARADSLHSSSSAAEGASIVAKYTKRAIVGAMAAVMPGTDLVIQSVLATGLIRELARNYDVPVRDIDIEGFLAQVRLNVRTSASLVLAIAGNAAKAFPGVGTLAGGAMHAVAYGLVFDSLGSAVDATFREHQTLDSAYTGSLLAKLLADSSAERLRRIVEMATGDGEKQ